MDEGDEDEEDKEDDEAEEEEEEKPPPLPEWQEVFEEGARIWVAWRGEEGGEDTVE